MPDIQIKIKNLPQIRAAFKRAPYLMGKEMRIALERIGAEIMTESQANTPVDTGRLFKSHYQKFNPYSALGYYLEVGTGIPKNAQAYYDVYVHEGTRYQKAQPYLKRAVEHERGSVDDILAKAVQRVLNQIGAKV